VSTRFVDLHKKIRHNGKKAAQAVDFHGGQDYNGVKL
jgi:hypothetical protein